MFPFGVPIVAAPAAVTAVLAFGATEGAGTALVAFDLVRDGVFGT